MKLHRREIILAGLTGLTVLTMGTWVLIEPRVETLRENARKRKEVKLIIKKSEARLNRREEWNHRLDALRERLPSYAPDREATADIMRGLETTARKSGLMLLKASPDEEEQVGDLYEISIRYDWEADLTSLVRFLYALQAESVNLDIRQLNAQPQSGQEGRLKGSFTVDFAYTRGNTEPAQPQEQEASQSG
jgi:Tfp pilus assembly protein PilO